MKKHALLVGVEEYRDKMISRLNFACADATALAERLCGRCGFDEVRVLANENGEDEPLLVNIVTALRDVASEQRPDDLFLFFFAGHGVEKDGHGYLLARDSLQAFPEHGSLSLELLRKTFEHLSASKRILLLDACRNSPDAGRSDAANCMGDVISRDIVAAARSKLAGGTTTALLSACRSGQRAYEWPAKGHGVFTQYLIEGLDGAAWMSGELEFDRLAGYAAGQVRQWAANTPGLLIPQEPWYEKFGDPESIILAVGELIGSAGQTRPTSSRSKTAPVLSETAVKPHKSTRVVDKSDARRNRARAIRIIGGAAGAILGIVLGVIAGDRLDPKYDILMLVGGVAGGCVGALAGYLAAKRVSTREKVLIAKASSQNSGMRGKHANKWAGRIAGLAGLPVGAVFGAWVAEKIVQTLGITGASKADPIEFLCPVCGALAAGICSYRFAPALFRAIRRL